MPKNDKDDHLISAQGALEKLDLPQSEAIKMLLDAVFETGAGLIPGVGTLLDFTNRLEEKIRERKLSILLQSFAEHFGSIDEAISRLKFLHSNPSGIVLFHKIILILNNGSDEEEWIQSLANVLKNLSESEIEDKFEEYKYALSQIERLTAQAVIILSKYDVWKEVTIQNTTSMSGQTISGDWDSQATNYLIRSMGIGVTESGVALRMMHSFEELKNAGLVLLDHDKLKLSIVGAEIVSYITIH